MEQYHALLKEILGRGDVQFEPRTQEYILGISAWQSIYDLREGFPLMTTKNVPPRLPFEELFWKLRGERNVQSLVKRDIHIWTANAFDRYLRLKYRWAVESNPEGAPMPKRIPKHSKEWNEEFEYYKKTLLTNPQLVDEGELGPVYGYQWRHWKNSRGEEVDQLQNLLENMKEKPGSRYHVLSAWNVGDLPDMSLGPCPFWHQFSVWANDDMDLTMVQRSCDVFLGVPFNIAQDSLLAHMVAKETGYNPRFFNHSYNNVHAYLGVPPRSDFWMNDRNVAEFQERFNAIDIDGHRSEYIDLKDWYLKNAPPESEGNERKDHVPFILEQLSIIPRPLPKLEINSGVPLFDAIEMPAIETGKEIGYAKIVGYEPAKWDSKAVMAA